MAAVQKAKQERSEPTELSHHLTLAGRSALAGGEYRISSADLMRQWGRRFTAAELHEAVVPERTLARRLANRTPLTVDETDRALRLARIATEAERVFGDREKADHWLRQPNESLAGRSPLALLRADAGAYAVSELLVRIDHGIYA